MKLALLNAYFYFNICQHIISVDTEPAAAETTALQDHYGVVPSPKLSVW